MSRVLAACFLAVLVTACETPTFSALDDGADQWRLVFEDEFEGTGRPDPRKWISKEYNRRPNPDGPDGWWDPANAYLNGMGQLVLLTSVIPNRNPEEDSDPYDYATAMVSTEGTFEPTYGRFEVRAKLPRASGWWSAFWLFSSSVHNVDGSGRDGTEVDIMETFGWTDKVNHALHWDGYDEAHKWSTLSTTRPGIRRGWHTYTLEWYPDLYIFYVDGKETWRTSDGGVSQVPLWVKLSGELDTTDGAANIWWANTANPRDFPDRFLVDWVRVYEHVPGPGRTGQD
jgi:beta-glucanase (GH16 family)